MYFCVNSWLTCIYSGLNFLLFILKSICMCNCNWVCISPAFYCCYYFSWKIFNHNFLPAWGVYYHVWLFVQFGLLPVWHFLLPLVCICCSLKRKLEFRFHHLFVVSLSIRLSFFSVSRSKLIWSDIDMLMLLTLLVFYVLTLLFHCICLIIFQYSCFFFLLLY